MNATPSSSPATPVIVCGGGIGGLAAVFDAAGGSHRGLAVIGADGVKSAVRRQYVGDEARVSSHVVYCAMIDKKDFPANLQWNAA